MVIKELKPNHVCCNPKCTKGDDGGRKKYYACDYCDRIRTWKSMCCSVECFNEMFGSADKAAPIRTDKTEEEVAAIMSKDEDEVLRESVEELSAYSDTIEEDGILAAVEEANADIESKSSSKKSKK